MKFYFLFLHLFVSHHGIMENRLFLCRTAHVFTGLTKVHVLVVNHFSHSILLIVVKLGTDRCLVSL